MADLLTDRINEIRSKIEKFRQKGINEAQTKEWLIKPLFEALGWNFSNPDEIIPEDDDSAGKRPDYGFYLDGHPKFFVEAKAINNPLDDNKMIAEKLNYCMNAQMPFLIITNGILYKIYYAELKGAGKDKLLQEFSIVGDYDEDVIDLLQKDSFRKNRLLDYAKNIFVLTNIKKAIENIFQAPPKKVIEIINDKLKEFLGHKFGNDEIEEALKNFGITIDIDLFDSQRDIEAPKTGREDSIWTIEHQFKNGKWQRTFSIYEKLISQIRGSGIILEENPTKFYIGLLSSGKNFCSIHGQKSGLKVTLYLELSDLAEHETLRVRDVSNIGHWGLGDIECHCTNESDLDWVLPLIKKSYHKVTNS